MKEQLERRINDIESILQNIASLVSSGALSEKLSPAELLEKTQNNVNSLADLTVDSEELMLVLKPEKVHTVKAECGNLTRTLKTFRDILVQNTPEPLANSRLAFEQLRKALTDGLDLLFLMREVRDNPSPLIKAVLDLKKGGSVINTQSSEDMQPIASHVLCRVGEFQTLLKDLEKKVGEMKESMRELQEESLRILSCKTSEQPRRIENKTERRQLSLSNFKIEQN